MRAIRWTALAAVALLLGGCCAGVGSVLKVSQRQEVDLRASDYQSLGVRMPSDYVGDFEMGTEMLMRFLLPKLRAAGLVGSVGKHTGQEDLTLDITIVEFVPVSGAARFWLGMMAGASKMVLSCTLTDKEGNELGHGAPGGFSAPSGCTEGVVDITAVQVVNFLQGQGDLVR